MGKVSAVIKENKYRTEIQAGTHTIIADEPEELGGKNEGVSPDELLAASLAACTSITLRMYLDRKGWSVRSIIVDVDIQRDAKNNSSEFIRTIRVEGELDEKQQQRIVYIANACPIHKTLTGTITVTTQLIS